MVQGNVAVTNGNEIIQLGENQSTYIPTGTQNRLENPNAKRLILIEVQCGP